MTLKKLNQKEFDIAQKIMNDLDEARRNQEGAPDTLDKSAISKLIQETYQKQDIQLDSNVLEKLIDKHAEGQKEVAILLNKPLKADSILDFKNKVLEDTVDAIRNKKFFTNREFIEQLDYEKPKAPKMLYLGAFITLVGVELLVKSPLVSILIAGSIFGLGHFLYLENVSRWKANQKYINTFATNWKAHPYTYVLAYQKLSTELDGRLVDEDGLRSESMRYDSARISMAVFGKRKVVFPSMASMDFLKDCPDLEIDFKHATTKTILEEWKQKQAPIRLMDILLLYKLERKITDTIKTAQFLDNSN